MAAILETPSRVWRRIQDIEGQEMPSLPSIPVMDDLTEMHSETTSDLDASRESNPVTSTPAAFSSHHNTMSTIKQPITLSVGSTARFANSIASRPSKSSGIGMSASGSRGSFSKQQVAQQLQPEQSSFDISMIPSLPQPHDDIEIRSSDQDTHSSVADAYLPPMSTGAEEDLDISEALRSVSRSGSPVEQIDPAPWKNYDYSVSLKSEPKVSLVCSARISEVRTVFPSLLPSTNYAMSPSDAPCLAIRGHPVSHARTHHHHRRLLRTPHLMTVNPSNTQDPNRRHLSLRYQYPCHAQAPLPRLWHGKLLRHPCLHVSFRYHLRQILHQRRSSLYDQEQMSKLPKTRWPRHRCHYLRQSLVESPKCIPNNQPVLRGLVTANASRRSLPRKASHLQPVFSRML